MSNENTNSANDIEKMKKLIITMDEKLKRALELVAKNKNKDAATRNNSDKSLEKHLKYLERRISECIAKTTEIEQISEANKDLSKNISRLDEKISTCNAKASELEEAAEINQKLSTNVSAISEKINLVRQEVKNIKQAIAQRSTTQSTDQKMQHPIPKKHYSCIVPIIITGVFNLASLHNPPIFFNEQMNCKPEQGSYLGNKCLLYRSSSKNELNIYINTIKEHFNIDLKQQAEYYGPSSASNADWVAEALRASI